MGDAFQVFTRLPELNRKLRESPIDPANFIADGDNLHVRVWSSTALSVLFGFQTMLPDGRIVNHQHNLITPSDRTSNAFFFRLPECILLGLLANIETQDVGRGTCYVSVQLRRSEVSNGGANRHLVHGYVDGNISLQYPFPRSEPAFAGRGRIRSIVGTDPAAGVEISETVPTNAIWRLQSFLARLVTDATVGNRFPTLLLDDGANVFQRYPNSALQAASQTMDWQWSPIGAAFGSAGSFQLGFIPPDLYLPGGFRIRTSTGGIQAGDNWGAPNLLVEEWIAEGA